MSKKTKQMPVKYKLQGIGNVGDLWERSLDLILSPGCYAVEILHTEVDVGLPFEFCGQEHYIVGTLMVTNNGTKGKVQKERLTGQVLVVTLQNSVETKMYIRTRSCGKWSEWRSVANTGMYDKISTSDELVASVEELVNVTKSIQAELFAEITRAKDVETNIANKIINIKTLQVIPEDTAITISGNSIDNILELKIPAVTEMSAGIMSVEDKKKNDTLISSSYILTTHTRAEGFWASANPKILSNTDARYRMDYIKVVEGETYKISAGNITSSAGWVQIGLCRNAPAADVVIDEIVRVSDGTKTFDIEYRIPFDGYLVCFSFNSNDYSFKKVEATYMVPFLTEKVDDLEEAVSSLYEKESVEIETVVLDSLFLTAKSQSIALATSDRYKLAYVKVEAGKEYRVVNQNCSYSEGWAVVSFTEQVPAQGVAVTLLQFATGANSVVDYLFNPTTDGYLCATYFDAGDISRIFEVVTTDVLVADALKERVAVLETSVGISSIILPPKLFAVVGYEFNIYWDTIYTAPDYGAGCPNFMPQAVCPIGVNSQRSFRVTPTLSEVGEYDITIQVYNTDGKLVDESTSKLIVLDPAQISISNSKNVLSLGDSTIDDSGYMIKNLYSNINSLGLGSKIIPIGTRGFDGSKHEARTGYKYSGYLSIFKVCRIYVSNINEIVASINRLNVTPHPQYINPVSNSRIWVSDINVKEGWITADNNVLENGWSGRLVSYNTQIVDVDAIVTNVVNGVDSVVLYNNNAVDFTNYMSNVYGDSTKVIDVLTMANGINDCRGDLKTKEQIDAIVDNAKTIIDAFLSYNPNGKVLVALPKIKASTLIELYPSSYTLNSYNLRKKLNEVFTDYDERVILFGEVLGMDRFWGYPISEKAVAARIPEKITYNGDAVHPRNEGYLQIADTYLGALLYACKD